MAANANRKIFVNLSVSNLPKTRAFFSKLGFEFNEQFCDDNAACMVIGPDAFVMLLVEPFFKTFTRNEICSTDSHTECMVALSAGSREEVDELLGRAIGAGATPAWDPIDHGFMYSRSFYDLDRHHWEVVWMEKKAIGQ